MIYLKELNSKKKKKYLIWKKKKINFYIFSGPISSVYRVIERRTAKERIAKVVHNPKYFDWLRREMDILSHLHDSNIPHLHDAYETDKMLAIVLDKYV
jgi:serine/threonine protein kinase